MKKKSKSKKKFYFTSRYIIGYVTYIYIYIYICKKKKVNSWGFIYADYYWHGEEIKGESYADYGAFG